MFFDKLKFATNRYNGCVSKGNCSISPEVRALQEVILTYLRQLAFYELKLKTLNISVYENKEIINVGILTLISAADYSHDQMIEFISKIYSKLVYARQEYQIYCKENSIDCDDLRFSIKLSPEMTITEIIKLGEKALVANVISEKHKNLYEVLILLIKNCAINLIYLEDYDKFYDEAYYHILESLNLLNYQRTSLRQIKENIDVLASYTSKLAKIISTAQHEKFGDLGKRQISLSTTSGKAILVSGSNFNNLYNVLELTKDLGIDVYTHAELMIAHCFSKFKEFKHLKGHYGTCFNNCVLDFATFPGTILLTKNTYPNLEYLYRGKIFSAEEITPNGVMKIANNDFTPLIEATFKAKGFTKGRNLASITAGIDKLDLKEKIKHVSSKFKNDEIDKLIILGFSDYLPSQEEYFKKLYKSLTKNSYIITFSYKLGLENEISYNLANNLSIFEESLSEIFNEIPIDSDKIVFFFPKFDSATISETINLINMGAKNIYLLEDKSFLISPNIINLLNDLYGIKTTSTAKNDAKNIFENN